VASGTGGSTGSLSLVFLKQVDEGDGENKLRYCVFGLLEQRWKLMAKHCFVIMPFSHTTDEHSEDYWPQFFCNFIKPTVGNLGYSCSRSQARPSNIIKDISKELFEADLVLAVLTDCKPNVWYELGIRHALRRGTIMIIEEGKNLPFDINQYGVIKYKDTILGRSEFEGLLQLFVRNIETQQPADSPVADFFSSYFLQPALLAASVQGSPFTFESLIDQAEKKLFVIGQNLHFLAQDKYKERLFTALCHKSISVDIMICDDQADYILKAISDFTATSFPDDLRHSIDTFQTWQKEADKANLQLTVKLSKHLGTLSLTFVDPEEETGRLLLIPVFAESHTAGRPCFWLTKKEHEKAFSTYFQVYETLWRAREARRICEKGRP
jgi:hypothetical protein